MKRCAALLTLLFVALVVGGTSHAASNYVTLEKGIKRSGPQYRSVGLKKDSPELCREACADDENCKAYTYEISRLKGYPGRCLLYDSVPPAKENDCCVSGVKTTKSPTVTISPPVSGPIANIGAPQVKGLQVAPKVQAGQFSPRTSDTNLRPGPKFSLPCMPGPGQVALFLYDNFAGQCTLLDAGAYVDEQSINLPNNSVSSVRVGPNAIVKLCGGTNLNGTCENIYSDDKSLSDNRVGNDNVSSVYVFSGSPNCSPAADEVALFLHDQYRGYCTILKKGFYYDPPTMNFPNDQLSSVRVGSNAAVVLYEHDDLRGKREILRVSDSNLSDNLIGNDKVSSVAVFASERDCKPKANQVAVYSHTDFGGLCTTLDYGIHAHTAHTNLPDGTISSIRVGAKAEALLCRDMNFEGKCATFTKDDANLADNGLNDSVSSLLVWKRNKSNLARVWWNYNLGPSRRDNIRPQIKNRQKIVIVLRDPVRPGHPRPSANDIYRIFSGLQDSVNAYFRENSSSLYQIEIVGFYGWFTPEPRKRGNFYWNYNDPNDSDGDGWISGHMQRWVDAVRALDQQFYFDKKYDNNGDGTLSPNELGIVIITPQSDSIGGNRRPVYADQVTFKPHRKMLKVDNGLIVPEILEIFLSPALHLGLTAHEMCHLTLGLGDMYWGSNYDEWYNQYAARAYSVMADFTNHSHLDAVLKLKLGWAAPQAILDSGNYLITDVESTNRIWLIFDPNHGFDEYFILENRWPGTSYERNLPDSGIAIWNVFDITSENSQMPKPLCTPTTRWNDWNALPLEKKNWERRAIRLIRSGGLRFSSCESDRPLADDTAALWGPTGFFKNLRWADNTNSGVLVRPLTSPSPAMTVQVTLPVQYP